MEDKQSEVSAVAENNQVSSTENNPASKFQEYRHSERLTAFFAKSTDDIETPKEKAEFSQGWEDALIDSDIKEKETQKKEFGSTKGKTSKEIIDDAAATKILDQQISDLLRSKTLHLAVSNTKQEENGILQAENFFRRSGDFWTIRYEGKEKTIRNVDGLYYIALLLKKPGESISCVELQHTKDGLEFKSKTEAMAEGLHSGFFSQPIYDKTAQINLWNEYQKLQKEIDDSVGMPDHGIIEAENKPKMGELLQFLKDKKRAFPDPNKKKAQSNVKLRLGTACELLKQNNLPDLAAHLDKSIKTDKAYGLRYVAQVDWDIILQ